MKEKKCTVIINRINLVIIKILFVWLKHYKCTKVLRMSNFLKNLWAIKEIKINMIILLKMKDKQD